MLAPCTKPKSNRKRCQKKGKRKKKYPGNLVPIRVVLYFWQCSNCLTPGCGFRSCDHKSIGSVSNHSLKQTQRVTGDIRVEFNLKKANFHPMRSALSPKRLTRVYRARRTYLVWVILSCVYQSWYPVVCIHMRVVRLPVPFQLVCPRVHRSSDKTRWV
jgi:hypothetical protein